MRRLATVLAAATLTMLTAACASTQHVAGDAALNGSATTAPTTAPTTVAPVVTEVPSSAPASSSSPTPTGPDNFLISRDGIGPLHLGMSVKSVQRSGLVGPLATLPGGDICLHGDWKDASSDPYWEIASSDGGTVQFDGKSQLVFLAAYGDQHTAKGIKVGDSPSQVIAAYPTGKVNNYGSGNPPVNPPLTKVTSAMKAGDITVSLGGGVQYVFHFGFGRLNQLAVERTTIICGTK